MDTYGAPRIMTRMPIADPLVGVASGTPSAAFRTTDAVMPYVAPIVETRTPLEGFLVTLVSGVA